MIATVEYVVLNTCALLVLLKKQGKHSSLSREFFKEAIRNYGKVVMSGYVTDANGVQDSV